MAFARRWQTVAAMKIPQRLPLRLRETALRDNLKKLPRLTATIKQTSRYKRRSKSILHTRPTCFNVAGGNQRRRR